MQFVLKNTFFKKEIPMKKYTILFYVFLFSLLWSAAAYAQNAVIRWPGEKKFEGYTNFDQLQGVFASDTTAYGRRYLIQALPMFVQKNNITYAAPNWLVDVIAKALGSNDPNLIFEAILAMNKLKIYSLSDSLTSVYRKARRIGVGEMPKIHSAAAGCLMDFNRPESRRALTNIALIPFPASIATDIVPALKGLNYVADSTCLNDLSRLSTRLQKSRDSLRTNQRMAHLSVSAADTLLPQRLGQMVDLVEKIKISASARGVVR